MIGTSLDSILTFLIPMFLRGAPGDPELAQQAAIELLESHAAATGAGILVAAELIAHSFTLLDNLGKSMAEPDVATDLCLRLRSGAIAFGRAAERNRQWLSRAAKDPGPGARTTADTRATPSAPRTASALLPAPQQIGEASAVSDLAELLGPAPRETHESPASPEAREASAGYPAMTPAMQKVHDAIVEAAPDLADALTSVSQGMSRQQRRFLMRKTERARLALERDARKAARDASRMAPPAPRSGENNPIRITT